MTNNNSCLQAIDTHLRQRRLSKALAEVENHALYHSLHSTAEQAAAIRQRYDLMRQYWQTGYADPMREKYYDALLQEVYTIAADADWRQRVQSQPLLTALANRIKTIAFADTFADTADALRCDSHTRDKLNLLPQHTAKNESKELGRRHQNLLSDTFARILIMGQWTPTQAETMLHLLIDDAIATNDKLLIVSAITLAGTELFDAAKSRTLLAVHQQATDTQLRQRALIGLTMTADSHYAALFPELKQLIDEALKDEDLRQELAELQMQALYCINSEKDTKTIQDEIMPELLKSSNIRITPHGLEQLEQDPLEEILHPDAEERKMERIEESMRRMADMQRQGVDIYFGGFKQMKRFAFFSDIANWFMPFDHDHPDIITMWEKARAQKFLRMLTATGTFCDSDLYSLVAAFDMVVDRLPAEVTKMLEQGEAQPETLGGDFGPEAIATAAHQRRRYLQNLYRFYRLYPSRQLFRDPFDVNSSHLFCFTNPLFVNQGMSKELHRVATFAIKHGQSQLALRMLSAYNQQDRDYDFCILAASLAEKGFHLAGNQTSAQQYYQEALQLKPNDRTALRGLARCQFADKRYAEAQQIFTRLLADDADNRVLLMNEAVCQVYLGQTDEAQKTLYRLIYDREDDVRVMRVLAWTLLHGPNLDQAERYYRQIATADDAQPTDRLYYGYCLWFEGKPAEAAKQFKAYLSLSQSAADNTADDDAASLRHMLIEEDATLLQNHGITLVDVNLMLDLCDA